jgi:hypothetical protein
LQCRARSLAQVLVQVVIILLHLALQHGAGLSKVAWAAAISGNGAAVFVYGPYIRQFAVWVWVGPEVPGHAQHGLLGCGRAMGRMGPVFGAVCVSVQSFSLGVCT